MSVVSGWYRTPVGAGAALVVAGAVEVLRNLLVATGEPSAVLELLSNPWVGSLPAVLIYSATVVLVVGLWPERGIAKARATSVVLVAYGATWLLGLVLGLVAADGGANWVWAGSSLDVARIGLGLVAGVLVAREAVLRGLARWSLLIVAATHIPSQLTSLIAFPAWAPHPSMWEQLTLAAVLFWGATYVVDGLPKRTRAAANG
ncbi:hypothetical protein [Agrococcus sp. TSP3-2-1]|uniref:hypothetical protein n=1 Tax=Agrococcus sp. TSP3-2-1 TaxID=2804583 RepID=UPI003CEBDFC9